MKSQELKSLHFIPANKPQYLDSILKSSLKPDALVFDLEDSIQPAAKDFARTALHKMLEKHKSKLKKYIIIIRPNTEKSPYFRKDASMIKRLNPNMILLPKVEKISTLKNARKIFKRKPIIAAIETIKGINVVDKIAANLTDLDALVVGYEDLSADLQIERPNDLNTINPLTQLIFTVFTTARKHKIRIFDAVCRYYKTNDLHWLEQECAFTSNLRFQGKFSIHPNQINIINKYFEPKKLHYQANQIVQQFYGIKDGSAIIVKDQQMMDTPSLKMYEQIINKSLTKRKTTR